MFMILDFDINIILSPFFSNQYHTVFYIEEKKKISICPLENTELFLFPWKGAIKTCDTLEKNTLFNISD